MQLKCPWHKSIQTHNSVEICSKYNTKSCLGFTAYTQRSFRVSLSSWGWGCVGPINLEFYYGSVNGDKSVLLACFYLSLYSTNTRYGIKNTVTDIKWKAIGIHARIHVQFTPACIRVGEEE